MRIVAACLALAGCGLPSNASDAGWRTLEIGTESDGAFQPLLDSVRVDYGSMGLPHLHLSLRATDIDPSSPEVSVQLTVDGSWMGNNSAGPAIDMEPDGEAWVLPHVRVPFAFESCCYACRDGTIAARLTDGSGRTFHSEMTLQLIVREECPDPVLCCDDADRCPDPAMAQVCQPPGP